MKLQNHYSEHTHTRAHGSFDTKYRDPANVVDCLFVKTAGLIT
jgi:hypothetical protein